MKRLLMVAILLATTISPAAFAATSQTTENSQQASNVVVVTNDNFNSIIDNNEFVVIDFWADWCVYCHAMNPAIKKLAAEYKGKVVIGKCNTDENRNVARICKIQGLPTILLFKGGKLVDQQVGYCSKETLKAKIEQLIK